MMAPNAVEEMFVSNTCRTIVIAIDELRPKTNIE